MNTLANWKWMRRLGLPLLTALLVSPGAFAQTDADEAAEEAKELGKVTITGSRIRRTATEGPSPVLVIDREQIEREGFTTVEGALKSLTQATGVVQTELFAGGFTQNANALDLRGLGPGRTLILIDGRRVADYPLAYNGQSNIVNISAIPLAAVERFEVLSGGASAIYGSDAVSGVVNIIMRKDFGNSIDMNLRAGTTSDGGMDTARFQAVGGFLGRSWNVTYALEYMDRDALYASDRDYMASSLSNPNPEGRTGLPNAVELDLFGAQLGFPEWVDPGDCDGFAGTGIEYWERSRDRFYCGSPDAYGEQSIVNAREQFNTYLTGTLELGQAHELYGSVNYFELEADLDTAFRYYFNQDPLYFPNSNAQSLQQFGVPGSYGLIQRIFTNPEIGGPGAQNDFYEETVLDYSVGIRGDFFSPLWQYDVVYGHSEYDLTKESTLIVEQAAQDYFFTSYDDTIPDPFGFGFATATLNYENFYTAVDQATFESLTDLSRDGADTSVDVVTAVINGDLFDLPAGPLGMAVVGEWATQEYDINIDPRIVSADYFWGLTGTGGQGERDRYAFGLEFNAPITSMLTLTAAGRYDKYDDITQVDDATTYNVGLQFRPNDKILIRGTAATTFRAPDMHYVFADESGFFTDVVDEYLCQRDEPDVPIDQCTFNDENIFGARSGNPLLQEEEGETYTYGIVLEPVEDLYFSFDYYEITLEGIVIDNPLSRVLEIEADCRLGRTDINSGECIDALSRITRQPADIGLLSERLIQVDSGPVNAAEYRTKGFDTRFQYSIDTVRGGTWGLDLTYSHVRDAEFRLFPEDELEYDRSLTRDWRSRVRGSLNWRYKDFGATLFGERFGSSLSADNVRGVPGRDIGPQMFYNFSATYRFLDERASVSLIVNNLFNDGPPYDETDTAWPYFDELIYGFATVGRQVYGQFQYRFDY